MSSTAINNNFNTDVSSSTVNQTVNSNSASTVNSNNLNRNVNENTSTSSNTNLNTNFSTSTSNNTNLNTNVSTSTSDNRNVNINQSDSTSSNTNFNTNVNQSDSRSVSENTNINQNNNVNVSDSKSTSYSEIVNRQIIDQNIKSPPPSAIAPSMMSYSQDLCTTGISAAVQTQILGFSGGKTVRDKNCEALKLSKTMYDMGMRVAAVSLLCQDERVFEAMKMAGTPCPYNGRIGKEAEAAWEENPDAKPNAKRRR